MCFVVATAEVKSFGAKENNGSYAWRKNTNKMQQYKWFIVNSRCWLLTTVSVVNNQHLELKIDHLYCCILLVFFLHALLTMHGHRNIKPQLYFTREVARECQRRACFIRTAIFSNDRFLRHVYTKLEKGKDRSNAPWLKFVLLRILITTCGAVGLGVALQTGRLRVRFLMG